MRLTTTILHVDNHLLCMAKPAGMPSVPDESGDESLLDLGKAWIAREYGKPGDVFLGVVHRLDRPVSGVLVFARTSKAARRLTDAFRRGHVEKVYWGVSARAPVPQEGELLQWLVKDRRRNVVACVAPEAEGSKRALSRWSVLDQASGGRTLLELRPLTGRSHQLRVAASSLQAPLLGDLKYGAERALPDRSIALHAHELAFAHPVREDAVRLRCAPPTLDCWRFPYVELRRRSEPSIAGPGPPT